MSNSTPCLVRLGIRYDKGSGAIRSYELMGQPVGAPGGHPEPDLEYNLYTEATKRHASLIPTAQASISPSGWYELLRFGRNLGLDPLPGNCNWSVGATERRQTGCWRTEIYSLPIV